LVETLSHHVGWPQTVILLLICLHVARITSVSHRAWSLNF
jgi:hypothetical protein